MDIFDLCLTMNAVAFAVSQTCNDINVQKKLHKNKRLDEHQFSCLPDLTIDQCALECLLVGMCKSFNYIDDRLRDDSMCELNTHSFRDVHSQYFVRKYMSMHVDIQDWPETVAKTCASRPCADNQRCIPVTHFKCIDIDCGAPPYVKDARITRLTSGTSLGSIAHYECSNENEELSVLYNFACDAKTLCNSGSSWTPAKYPNNGSRLECGQDRK